MSVSVLLTQAAIPAHAGPAVPRPDTIEIWLPEGAHAGSTAVTTKRQSVDLLEVVYFQRPADGLLTQNVLDEIVKGGWRFGKTQVAGDRSDALTCHQDMSPEMFAQFKALALALFDAGMPVTAVKSYDLKEQNDGAPTKMRPGTTCCCCCKDYRNRQGGHRPAEARRHRTAAAGQPFGEPV